MKLEDLSDAELKLLLEKHQLPQCPITPTTRKLLLKKLEQKINAKDQKNMNCETNNGDEEKENPLSKYFDIRPSNAESNLNTSFYGVHKSCCSSTPTVVRTLKDAITVAKSSPGSRFKAFKSFEEAESFSQSPVAVSLFEDSLNLASSDPTSKFSHPKPSQFSNLRSLIEKNEILGIKSLVESNPKYLISSSDTPTILHEGFHRNSLHIAVCRDKPDVVLYLLRKLKDYEWLQSYYQYQSADASKNLTQVSDRLVDLYLNTPDKCQEVPLHIATKFGFSKIVKILLGEPLIDRSLRNKFYETSEEQICTRVDSCEKQDKESEICALFKYSWFVSVEKKDDFVVNSPRKSFESTKNIICFVGPTEEKQALYIYRVWCESLKDRDGDPVHFGRTLSKRFSLAFKERFDFFGGLIDMSTIEGIEAVEEYLLKNPSILNRSHLFDPLFLNDPSQQNFSSENQASTEISELNRAFSKLVFENTSSTSIDFTSPNESFSKYSYNEPGNYQMFVISKERENYFDLLRAMFIIKENSIVSKDVFPNICTVLGLK